MSARDSQYRLPKEIERHLAALSKLYSQEGERQKLEIVVNAQVRVHEAWSSDNWDGGTYGHAIFLTVPEALYLKAVRKREDLQKQMKADVNQIHNVQNEFIEEVFLEMEVVADRDWRRESGLLRLGKRVVAPAATKRIWGNGGYRVFLSHKAEVKRKAADLKASLERFGITCFVAHEDIHPTKEWQDEIENALVSMDAFVALMTENFHDSMWTDQEVGFALCRGVPIIAVKLGKDPYGFIGKFQALSCQWDTASNEITKLLIKQPRMLDAYISALEECSSFDEGNTLAEVLPYIDKLTDDQAKRCVSIFNENSEIRGSFGFNGTRSRYYGDGLAAHLSRMTGRKYSITPSGTMRSTP